jgi:hypothetical protein
MKQIKASTFVSILTTLIVFTNIEISTNRNNFTFVLKEISAQAQNQQPPATKISLQLDKMGFVPIVLSIISITNATLLLALFFSLRKKSSENINYIQSEIKSSKERVTKDITLLIDKKNKVLGEQIVAVDTKTQGMLSEIKRKAEDLQQTVTKISQKSSFIPQPDRNMARVVNERQSPSSDRYPSASIDLQPSYVSCYNNRRQNFQDTYKTISVERQTENYKLSRSGKTEDVILDKQNQGEYWLFVDSGKNYIVPKQALKIREDNFSEVQTLFECISYQEDNHSNFTLIKPAVITDRGNGTWQLKEKGKLQFG